MGELLKQPRVAGVKQSRKAIRSGRARLVLLAADADPRLTAEIRSLCDAQSVPFVTAATMAELGRAAGIEVGAAVVVLLHR